MSPYSYQFPEASQHSGQHTGFFESHSHRLDSEPSSRFSSGLREMANSSYRTLEEELSRTVERLNTAERDLAIQKALNAQMQAQLDRSMTALAMSRTLVPAQSNSPVPVKPSRHDKEDPDGPPILPPALSELDPEDYPDARYWTQSSWTEYKKNQLNQGSTIFGLGFLCDADGNRVSKDRLDAMTKRAKQLWNTLFRHRQDPFTWGKKGDFVADFFSRQMRNSFPEFGLCEGNWKADAFAIVRYPDWSSKVRSSGTILQEKPVPKTKKQKIKAVLLPVNTTVIHIDDDDDDIYADPPTTFALPTTTANATPTAPPPTTTTSPTLVSSSSSAPIDIPSTSSQGSDQLTTPTRLVDSARTCPPSISNSDASSPVAAAALQDPKDANLTSADKTATDSTEQPEPGPNAALLQTLVQVNDQAGKVPHRSRRQIDPLQNLVVPPPPEEVPSTEQMLAPPANTKTTTKRATKAKADDKELSVGKALSARNMYATEYKKSHPRVTVGEYRIVWDNLAEATRKEFEQLCKAQKAEKKRVAGEPTLVAVKEVGDATDM
ncbi:hypothetical protein BYT27DRAFT_7263333 [Phlegmacium glaucopus]|nr:hypothetical protein BYT27DRAFT_7263333 [Phlegmacium glaucopus]